MPKKKPSIKANKLKSIEVSMADREQNFVPQSSARSQFITPRNIVLIVILVIALLLWKFKGSFIAAMVNGQPISRWELNNQLSRKFGDQMLENLINERLILASARQKGVLVTNEDIDKKVKEIETRLAGQTSLSEALKAQGLTTEEFRHQLEIQLSIDKMFDKEASISTTDIEDYISKNSQVYKSATDGALVRQEVTDVLKQQKISDLFEKWFTDIKKSASVKKFI